MSTSLSPFARDYCKPSLVKIMPHFHEVFKNSPKITPEMSHERLKKIKHIFKTTTGVFCSLLIHLTAIQLDFLYFVTHL